MGRCDKYVGEQSGWHPGNLTWPGMEYPYLGDKVVTDDAFEYSPSVFFFAKLFDLGNKEDLDHYVWVNDRIVNGWFVQYTKHVKPPEEESKGVLVYLEWGQIYLVRVRRREPVEDVRNKKSILWI